MSNWAFTQISYAAPYYYFFLLRPSKHVPVYDQINRE